MSCNNCGKEISQPIKIIVAIILIAIGFQAFVSFSFIGLLFGIGAMTFGGYLMNNDTFNDFFCKDCLDEKLQKFMKSQDWIDEDTVNQFLTTNPFIKEVKKQYKNFQVPAFFKNNEILHSSKKLLKVDKVNHIVTKTLSFSTTKSLPTDTKNFSFEVVVTNSDEIVNNMQRFANYSLKHTNAEKFKGHSNSEIRDLNISVHEYDHIQVSDILMFELDTFNKKDKNSVRVLGLVNSSYHTIGYVPKGVNLVFNKWLKENARFTIKAELHGGKYKYLEGSGIITEDYPVKVTVEVSREEV